MITGTDVIQELGLVRHREGGYYREFYRSGLNLREDSLPEGYTGGRNPGSVIYYMLTGNDFSELHSLRSDEIWHFHAGSAFLLHVISPLGDYRRIRLGPDVNIGEVPCFVVPGGFCFGAEVSRENSFALASCTVIPGFSFDDFCMPGRETLLAMFPALSEEIIRLTRKA